MLSCYFGHKVIIGTRENSCWEHSSGPGMYKPQGFQFPTLINRLNREGVGAREGKRKKEGKGRRKEGGNFFYFTASEKRPSNFIEGYEIQFKYSVSHCVECISRDHNSHKSSQSTVFPCQRSKFFLSNCNFVF